ncbi:MAG: hypothetical protein HFJ25_03225 [Clostridia bacterium]|nr:hypothetical protein [Clostridia bacterium]
MSFLFDNLFNFNNKSGIVNVRMVITEEKILSNIEKVQKMINPKSKKQIVQLEEDSYFKDLVESIKTYLEEYPKKKNFPRSVYKAAYDLVEFATNQFEDNTKKIEELIIQREKNIGLAYELKTTLSKVEAKEEGYEQELETAGVRYSEDIVEALKLISEGTEEEQAAAKKLVDARINNLESNFHIEIDMERIEDKSKALSFIGIEIAEALKYIPAPVEEIANIPVEGPVEQTTSGNIGVQGTVQGTQVSGTVRGQAQGRIQNVAAATTVTKTEKKVNPILAQTVTQEKADDQILSDMYMQETRFDVKPSLWQRIKNSKLVQTIRYIMKIKVVLEFPALPEGRGENNF